MMANILKPPCDEGVILAKSRPRSANASNIEASLAGTTSPGEARPALASSYAGGVDLAEARPSNTGLWVLVATILGSSMAFIDGTVVNVALPVLQIDLKATVADVQSVVEAYALFLAVLILVGGSFSSDGAQCALLACPRKSWRRSHSSRVGLVG